MTPTPTPGPFNIGNEYGFGDIGSLSDALSRLTGPAFQIAAVAVIIYFVIGALKYLISAGDKNAVTSARSMITHAIIGFILLLLMFLILEFIPQFFGLRTAIFR